MARWSDEKTLFFINCYKEYGALWNPTLPAYKSRTTREDSYRSLLRQVADDNLTLQSMKLKIKSLRSTYHQEVKKIEHSKIVSKLISDPSTIYKPSIVWFDEMHSFMGPLKKRKSTISTDDDEEESDSPDIEIISDSRMDSTRPQFLDAATIKPRAKKRLLDVTEPKLSGVLDRLENISTIINTPKDDEDEFHFFGMNVAAQLRKLPPSVAMHMEAEFQHKLYLARVRSENPGTSATASVAMAPHTAEGLSETYLESVKEEVPDSQPDYKKRIKLQFESDSSDY